MTIPGLFVVLLAAGASRRFGRTPKLDAPLGGRPLGAHAAEAFAGLGGAGQAAFVRHIDGPFADAARALGYAVIANPDADEGQAASLRHGVAAARHANAGSVLVVLADMPFVPRCHALTLAAALDEAAISIAASEAADTGRAGPPAIFSACHFDAIARLSGDEGARAILAVHAASTRLVPLDPLALRDIDTLAALAAAERAMAAT